MKLNELNDWQREFVRLCVVYRIADKNEKIDLIPSVGRDADDAAFIEDVLYDMQHDGFLEAVDGEGGEQVWGVTDKGRQLVVNAVQAIDRLKPFEIFGAVDLTRNLTDEEILSDEDPFLVRDEIYDPRFAPYNQTSQNHIDLRLGVLLWLSDNSEGQAENLSPHRIVFVRNLANGDFDKDDFWFNLCVGEYFNLIEEIVNTAYTWDLLSDNEGEAHDAMFAIYTAGMTERLKRDGVECSNCGSPLGAFMDNAQRAEEGPQELDGCPCCGADFGPPPAPYECPSCHGELHGHETSCPHCQADIDWNGQEGAISHQTITETTEEESYNEYYSGYDPYGYCYDPYYYDYGYVGWYGYYDPWDPYDALATAIILDAVF